jgi:hypothetical protein
MKNQRWCISDQVAAAGGQATSNVLRSQHICLERAPHTETRGLGATLPGRPSDVAVQYHGRIQYCTFMGDVAGWVDTHCCRYCVEGRPPARQKHVLRVSSGKCRQGSCFLYKRELRHRETCLRCILVSNQYPVKHSSLKPAAAVAPPATSQHLHRNNQGLTSPGG